MTSQAVVSCLAFDNLNSGIPRMGDFRKLTFLQFNDYDVTTGGYVYNQQICRALQQQGWKVRTPDIGNGFPEPGEDELRRLSAIFSGLESEDIVLIDQVCLARIGGAHPGRHRMSIVNIFHHPMSHDHPPAIRHEIDRLEAHGLELSAAVLTTSESTRATLRSLYSLPEDKIILALPGTSLPPRALEPKAPPSGSFAFITVGAVTRRKCYGTMIEALALVASRNWNLRLIGNTTRDADYTRELTALIDHLGLDGQVQLTGAIPKAELDREWDAADLYLCTSLIEGYGMAAAEAIARGIPIAMSPTSGLRDWLPVGCAAIAADHSPQSLAREIDAALQSPSVLDGMRRAAVAAAASLPTWEIAAQRVSAALCQLQAIRGRGVPSLR